jgi:hypothetical protein
MVEEGLGYGLELVGTQRDHGFAVARDISDPHNLAYINDRGGQSALSTVGGQGAAIHVPGIIVRLPAIFNDTRQGREHDEELQ